MGLTCLLAVVVNVAETALLLRVVYPEATSKNYSVVQLGCSNTDTFGEMSSGRPPAVVFRLNGDIITTDVFSDLEHNPEMNQISFTFNQDQEGTFSCAQGGNEEFFDMAGR